MITWSRTSAIIGAVVWVALLWATPRVGPGGAMIARTLILAILVFTPLTLNLVPIVDRTSPHLLFLRTAQFIQPLAAALAVTSFFLPPGNLAASLVSGWFVLTVIAALFGMVRLYDRGLVPAEELCMDVGLLYLLIGGAWLVLSRLGARPLGFDDTIVLLTAVHFHYSGFVAPMLAGVTGRQIAAIGGSARKAFLPAAVGIVLGPAWVGIGIAFSHQRILPAIELIGVFAFSVSLMVLSALVIFVVVPRITRRLARGLLVASAASLWVTTFLACVYAVGTFRDIPVISIPRMVDAHGFLNALGFALCGLLAWTIVQGETPALAPAAQEESR